MDNLKTKLGKRIKDLRKSKNITQEQLAEMVNMDITSLSKIETGRNYPLPETIEKLSNSLDVEVEDLFFFKKNLSKNDYLEAIYKNIQFIKDDEEKLKALYYISKVFL